MRVCVWMPVCVYICATVCQCALVHASRCAFCGACLCVRTGSVVDGACMNACFCTGAKLHRTFAKFACAKNAFVPCPS